jgi:DNA repair exonuclease SbcCD ATPase subunit
MRLRRIELKNFKKLVDFQAVFSPGINVVKGPLNEMGKSTLLEAIVVALFRNPKSTAKELRDYVSWGSTTHCRSSLEFDSNEENRYSLEKDFGKGTARLIEVNTREELDTFKEISGKMAELLGTKSDTLFLCSSCIRQSEVSKISSGAKQITESLEEVAMGGKESTFAWQVVQKLDSKVADMKRGQDRPASNPGIVTSLKSRIQSMSQRYSDVKEEVSKVEAKKIELVEVTRQLIEAGEQYENARGLLEKNRQRKEIEASTQRLTKDYDGIEKLLGNLKKLREDFERAGNALTAIEGFRDKQEASELRSELDAARNRREIIAQDLTRREEELAEAKNKLSRRKRVVFFGSGKGIATALAVLAGGIIGVAAGSSFLLSLIILGAVFLAVSAWARIAVIRDKTSISVVEGRIQDMKKALDDLDRNERGLLSRANCNTVAEFNEKERNLYDWVDKKNVADLQLRAVLGGRTIEQIEEQRAQVARKLATEEAKLTDDLKQTLLNPEEYVALERRVQSLEERRGELEKQKSRCEIIIEQARFNIEDQTRLEEELKGLQETLQHEEKKVKIYGLARDFLSRARTEVLSSVEQALEKEIQKYLAIFTDGKYKQVEVNKEVLEFRVYSDEKGDWASPEELSGGAIDEFYLAFRLALVKLIFRDKKPPLLLDDPFVNFDSVRLLRTLEFLRTLAGEYQIIIFTLGDSYDKVADNIILLGEGT